LGGFHKFVEEERLGTLNENQCELTYINHIERGTGWNELGELEKVFPLLCPPKQGSTLSRPEMLTWQARYKLPDDLGRINVSVNPIFRARDLQLVLNFVLTARSAPPGAQWPGIVPWFKIAHESTIRAFHELTGQAAHNSWRIKQP